MSAEHKNGYFEEKWSKTSLDPIDYHCVETE